MIVAGVMSGTSADGVDVAVCRVTAGKETPRVKLLGHAAFPYTKAVRAAVLGAMDAGAISVAELARLHWRLGAVYADAVEKAAAQLDVKVELVGCHGQTIYHQGIATAYLGKPVRATWQMGEAAVIAERLRVPVVSDFRPADLAAGGQGAPLVPMLDYALFRSAKVSRVLQNLGGIGNLTALPAGCGLDGVLAFDTGPGNMVIDGCMERMYGRAYDRGGAVAARGRVLPGVVEKLLRGSYFARRPPKSCGREQFGVAFVSDFIAACKKAGARDADVVATATALTVEAVLAGYGDFVRAHLGVSAPLARVEYLVAGGGAKNGTLMRMLGEGFARLGVRVRPMEEMGISAQAKEGVAFALLAWMTWHRLASNVVTATGARRPVILGKMSHG